MIKEVKKLTVKYNDNIVGTLIDFGNKKIAFQYDDEWIKNGFSISPLSLPLSDKIYINQDKTFDGLFGVFYDSLPDGWGILLVKRMLARRGISYEKLSPLTKLSIISKNGLGALTYEPTFEEKEDGFDYDLDELAKQATIILEEKEEDVDLDKLFKLGGSSGGARPKAHLKIEGEDWIVKFRSSYDPKTISKDEYQANQLAKECGININEFNLFKGKSGTVYFGVKRFDRTNNKKVHMVSLSALLETSHREYNLDYIHLFQVIEKICIDKSDLYEAYKRMCFNVFYENKDDHGKNFAFLYDDVLKGYKLSPAYDITKTINMAEHSMTVNGNGKPEETDLLKVAEIMKLSISKCKQIIEETKSVLDTKYWKIVKKL